jgi:hypothetical protein
VGFKTVEHLNPMAFNSCISKNPVLLSTRLHHSFYLMTMMMTMTVITKNVYKTIGM